VCHDRAGAVVGVMSRAILRRAVARAGVYDLALRARLAAERRLRLGAYAAELRFFGGFIRPGDLCFDIGANLGQKTSLFLDLHARVVAVEPQPSCVRILRRSFGGRTEVEIVAAAVGANEGEAELFVCDETSTISSMSRRFVSSGRFATSFNWRQTIVVPTTTLDALVARYGVPAYCKIDVEGFEASVLAGLTCPLPLVSFEFSREFIDEARVCADRLVAIAPYGFDFVLNHAADRLVGSWIEPGALFARLEALPDPLLVGEIYARLNA
jgi:FkbM family methyltransferase